MGFRAYLRDALVFYITIHVYGLALNSEGIDSKLVVSVTLLFIITLWFLLERIGVLPKIS